METSNPKANPENVNNANEQTSNAAPVKKRRGVSNETRATSNLKFHEKDSLPSRLFLARVDSAKCAWAKIGEESTGMGDFAGHAIPRLEIHFTSIHGNVDERRHVTLTLNPVQSNTDTYVNGEKSWQVDRVLGYIKHILDIMYLGGRELNDEETEALSLTYDDCDDDGNYVPVDVEEVIAGWRSIFENTAAMLNGNFGTNPTGKACFKTDKGDCRYFIKLLRYIKTGRGANAKWAAVGNNGDLAFPSFIGEGVIEKQKSVDAIPVKLRVNEITESITPKQVESKTPSLPNNMPGGMPVGGVPMNDFGAGYNDAAAMAGGDMPF